MVLRACAEEFRERKSIPGRNMKVGLRLAIAALLVLATAAEGPPLDDGLTSASTRKDELVGIKSSTDGNGGSIWGSLSQDSLNEEGSEWPKLKFGVRTVVAIIVGGLGASLSTSAGLGGGGLFVPLFNLLLQFDTKTSAALSNFMIVGGQLVTMALNLMKNDPVHPENPLIDFDVALLLQPNLLLGISIGVIMNVVLPNWLITILLTVVLSYMTVHSFKSGLKRWDKETHLASLCVTVTAPKRESLTISSDESRASLLGDTQPESSSSSRYPLKKLLALAVVWLTFCGVQIIRSSTPGQAKCGIWYWTWTSIQIPLALCMTWYILSTLRKPDTKDLAESQEDGFVLGPEASALFPRMALMTGLLGGMLGIGGAMIINPMLTSVGMHPQVVAATSGFMVVFSSSMSVAQYWIMGRIPVNYALISAALSAIFSAMGILVVQRIINKYGRASVIVFIVAFVIGLSAVLMTVFGGWEVWKQFEAGEYMGFHYPC